jgi:hypothetical protein
MFQSRLEAEILDFFKVIFPLLYNILLKLKILKMLTSQQIDELMGKQPYLAK